MTEKSPAPALSRGLEILDLIARHGERSFKELKQHCGYNVSSLNRFLRTLLDARYLRKNTNGRYELGISAFQLSLRNSFWKLLIREASPVLERLSNELALAASLIGYLDDEMTVLAKVAHQDNVMHREIGEAKSDYLLSPWGYVFIAELAHAERAAFLNRVRDLHESQYELPNAQAIKGIVSSVKERGYGDDRGHVMARPVRRLAAPIHAAGELVGALSASSFASLMDDEQAQRIGRILVEEAKQISYQLR